VIKTTVEIAINKVFAASLRGPLIIMRRTTNVITNVSTPSARAPVCKLTFKEGPAINCLYFCGIYFMTARTPPTEPSTCVTPPPQTLIKLPQSKKCSHKIVLAQEPFHNTGFKVWVCNHNFDLATAIIITLVTLVSNKLLRKVYNSKFGH